MEKENVFICEAQHSDTPLRRQGIIMTVHLVSVGHSHLQERNGVNHLTLKLNGLSFVQEDVNAATINKHNKLLLSHLSFNFNNLPHRASL